MAQSETLQRIARLTPLADALGLLARLAGPVAPREVPVGQAFGLNLAQDVVAPSSRPKAALALRDGWAVRAKDVADAGPYGPIPLMPPSVWCEVGAPLPAGADAVAPLDAVVWRDGIAEAVAPVTPGEGALAAGSDMAVGTELRPAGARLRHSDIAALTAAGIDHVSVRAPRLRIAAAWPDPMIQAIVAMLAGAVVDAGGIVADDSEPDAEIIVGGTGVGRHDRSVYALAQNGTVAVHGIAIAPGETTALGETGGRPVLLVPGRIDSAVAAWLLIGRPLLARLCGGTVDDAGTDATLSRKVTSRLGFAEVVPVRRAGDMATPLASEYLSISALAVADGWIIVAADSEGYPAGARVKVQPLP